MPENSTLNSEPQAVVVRREPERDLITWTAPARPFKRYGRKFYVTIFSIVGIISIILFIAEGVAPVILLVSVIFLFYILSTVPPENIEYRITNKGVKMADTTINWQDIRRFSFLRKTGSDLLILDTFSVPNRFEIVIGDSIKENIRKEVSAYVPYEVVKPTFLDKVLEWFVKKLPESE